MRKICFSLLFLTFVTATLADVLLAQYGEDACLLTLTGQNRNRKVAGVVNAECGNERIGSISVGPIEIELAHSPPFGNWGVDSNYGRREDSDQFKGWSYQNPRFGKASDQWNSCTTGNAIYWPPNRDYYNANNYTTQASPFGTVTHGTLQYRTNVRTCPPPWWNVPQPSSTGCQGLGYVSQAKNYMTLYELDSPGKDDLVEKLNFPRTSVTLTGCTKEGCPEKTTGWVRMTSSSSSTAHVEAELRMKVKAHRQGGCDWSWTGGGG